MTRSVLITGSSGFIGRHLVSASHRAGSSVMAVDRRPHDGHDSSVDVHQAEADSPLVLSRIRKGAFDAVLHQAAVTDTLTEDEVLLDNQNVRVPLRLVEACATAGTMFVYASSGSVYGNSTRQIPLREDDVDMVEICSGPLNQYATSKLTLDRAMLQYNDSLLWIGLRYTNVFGLGEEEKGPMASILSQFIRRVASGEQVRVFSDSLLAARDYLPISALARAVDSILGQPPPAGIYTLGSGRPISFATLLGWCAEFAGRGFDVRLEPNPFPDR
jgi:ADP-L-glycero-D-manno-heptose 6-epimerase